MKNSQVADFNSWYKKNKLNEQDNDYKFNQERADRNRNYNTDWKSEDLVMLIDATQPWLQPIKWGDIYMVIGGVEDSLDEDPNAHGVYVVHMPTFINDAGSIRFNNGKVDFEQAGGVREFYYEETDDNENTLSTREVDTENGNYGTGTSNDDDDEAGDALDNHFKGSTPDDFPTF
mgnify:CR=1 FL=1